jgi:hypothetical protein
MSWIKRIFTKKVEKQCAIHSVVCSKSTDLNATSIDINGAFIKEDEFERLWIDENVDWNYGGANYLTDEEYIDYYIWSDQNSNIMFKKHSPDTMVISGNNPNIIFHGGCLGCISQRNHGIERCKGCKYFRANWSKYDLSIKGEESAKISSNDLKRILGRK